VNTTFAFSYFLLNFKRKSEPRNKEVLSILKNFEFKIHLLSKCLSFTDNQVPRRLRGLVKSGFVGIQTNDLWETPNAEFVNGDM
jgi:hypothetical protein